MIYVKIADLFSDKILSGEFQAKSRVPSIRLTASNFNVNMNTVVRAYELLEQKRLIYKKRGKGYFVVDDARDRLIRVHRKMFRTELLPKVIREMQLLNISIDDCMMHGINIPRRRFEILPFFSRIPPNNYTQNTYEQLFRLSHLVAFFCLAMNAFVGNLVTLQPNKH